MRARELTAHRLREVLNYEPTTGVFTWRVSLSNRAKMGSIAGTVSEGRRVMRVDGQLYRANRLAWLYVTGAWPAGEVDHIDTDSLNDRFLNLRDVPRSTNQQNQRRVRSDSKTGVQGVSLHRKSGLFQARIHVNGKTRSLGYYATTAMAHDSYVRAKRQLHEGSTL